MKTALLPLICSAALAGVALVVAGVDTYARVFTALGLPHVAVPLATDAKTRGEALFRAGDFEGAAAAFEEAGDAYNQGLAAAWSGDYASALVAWDRVLAGDPDDAETQANHSLVTSLLAGTKFDPVAPPVTEEKDGPSLLAEPGQGKGRASSTGDEAQNSKTGFWMPEIASEGLRRVPKIFDAQFVAANDRWLTTLEDQPGRYLRARLAAEQKSREAAGTALPQPEDPR